MKHLWIILVMGFCSCEPPQVNPKAGPEDQDIDYVDVPDTSDYARTGPGSNLIMIKASNGKYGFRHPDGQIVINPWLQQAQYFNEGLAAASPYGAWGYIDDQGYIDQEPMWQYTGSLRNGIAIIKNDGRYGIWNLTTGVWVMPRFFWADEFREGFCMVRDSIGKYAFINVKGNLVTPYQFDAAERVKNKQAKVKLEGGWRILAFPDSGQPQLLHKPLEDIN